jgi:ribonuclease-3
MPLNMDASIVGAEQVLGYTFTDRNRLWEALQAPGSGVWMVGTRHLYEGNKRLALKGDAALKNVIITDWYLSDGSRGKPIPTPRHWQLLRGNV